MMRHPLAFALVHGHADVWSSIASLVGPLAAVGVGWRCGSYASDEFLMPAPNLNWNTFSALVGALLALLAVLPKAAEFLNEQFAAARDPLDAVRERARANWFGGALILYVVLLTLSAASGFVIGTTPRGWAFALGFAPLWIIIAVLALGLAQDRSALSPAIGQATSAER